MILKLLGGSMIVLGCTAYGVMLAVSHKKEIRSLEALIRAVDRVTCELHYRLSPLPELCQNAADAASGSVKEFFLCLKQELNKQLSPNASECAFYALNKVRTIPESVKESLLLLGSSLGQFDVDGQLKGLEAVRIQTEEKKQALSANIDVRLRCYQTLGICAGAALAILFI